MTVYSRILQFLGLLNLVVCLPFTIYGHIFPNNIKGGMAANEIGSCIIVEAYFLMMILTVIYCFILGEDTINNLIKFNAASIILYIVFVANIIYCLLFTDTSAAMENGSSITSSKLMSNFALSLLLNLTVVIMSTNYIKSN